MARHAIEVPDPLVSLLDGRRVFTHERVDRGSHQRACRSRQPLKDFEAFSRGGMQGEALCLIDDEAFQQLSKNLVSRSS